MSILWTLRKWVDPIAYFREDEDKRRARESQPQDPSTGEADPPPDDLPKPPVQWFKCRVCDRHSTAEAYCPTCIALTMVPIR